MITDKCRKSISGRRPGAADVGRELIDANKEADRNQPAASTAHSYGLEPQADCGMLSMFGRTGDPQIGPHRPKNVGQCSAQYFLVCGDLFVACWDVKRFIFWHEGMYAMLRNINLSALLTSLFHEQKIFVRVLVFTFSPNGA